MSLSIFTRLLQTPLYLLWLSLMPFALLYKPTVLADFVPAMLVVFGITFSVIYRFKRGLPKWFDHLAYTATIVVALSIPYFLRLPDQFNEYHPHNPSAMWAYGPLDSLNPLLALILKGIATAMCGGARYLWHNNVEAYSDAYAGWAITSSIAWSITLWQRVGITGRCGLVVTLSTVWLITTLIFCR